MLRSLLNPEFESVDTGEATIGATGPITGLIGGDISTHSPDADGNIKITSGIDDSYSAYLLVCKALRVADNGTDITLTVSTDGGSSYETSGYGWAVTRTDETGSQSNDGGTNSPRLTRFSDEAANHAYSGVVALLHPTDSSLYTRIRGWGSFQKDSDTHSTIMSGGTFKTAATVDAVQVTTDGANKLDSGEVTLKGVF